VFSSANTALRGLVLDPILARCPGTSRLVLAADDALQLVPWDVLETAGGSLVGDTLRIAQVDSLYELLEPAGRAAPHDATFVAFGDIDYGPIAAGDARVRGGDTPAKHLPTPRFDALHHTRAEVREVAVLIDAKGGRTRVVCGPDASKANLLANAPGASLLHLATHGCFLPESFDGHTVRRADDLLPFQLEQQLPISALAPMTLCGLAMAGANREPTALGGNAAIVTAEELAALDLSSCQMAVLSACEGSVGLLQRGRGLASLRAGLRGAGARFVVASLWRVDDAATKALMVDFYSRLLQQPADTFDPGAALWAARLAAKERKAGFRDWAGWVVVGR
jgi:CHAT domain-containing protein